MNIVVFAFALVIPPVLGFLLVSVCWPSREHRVEDIWIKVCLSIGIGLGLTSWSELLTMVVIGSARIAATLIIEILVIAVLAGILRHQALRDFFAPSSAPPGPPDSTFTRILTTAFWPALLCAFGIFALRSFENPHGESDAWTFWNARARVFFRTGPEWRQIFSEGRWSFPTYPLQTSLNALRLWSAIGRESQLGPVVIAGLFTFAGIGLAASVVWRLRGPSQGAIAGLLLAGTPYFLKHGASQYADVPFGFYLLACLALLNLADELPEQRIGLFGLAGLNAGLAAWTKQEGLLLAGSVLVAVIGMIFLIHSGLTPDRRLE
jgi:hypothetical protein